MCNRTAKFRNEKSNLKARGSFEGRWLNEHHENPPSTSMLCKTLAVRLQTEVLFKSEPSQVTSIEGFNFSQERTT